MPCPDKALLFHCQGEPEPEVTSVKCEEGRIQRSQLQKIIIIAFKHACKQTLVFFSLYLTEIIADLILPDCFCPHLANAEAFFHQGEFIGNDCHIDADIVLFRSQN